MALHLLFVLLDPVVQYLPLALVYLKIQLHLSVLQDQLDQEDQCHLLNQVLLADQLVLLVPVALHLLEVQLIPCYLAHLLIQENLAVLVDPVVPKDPVDQVILVDQLDPVVQHHQLVLHLL